MTAMSPIMNLNYRKLVYFFKDEVNCKPKSAIIMPFLTDRRIVINANQTDAHLAYFDEHTKHTKTEDLKIYYISPNESLFNIYSVNGIRLVNKNFS